MPRTSKGVGQASLNFKTGEKALDHILNQLGRKKKSITRKAVNAGLRVIAKDMKQDAPKGKTKALKKSIGFRFLRTRKDAVLAKAGINVAKKPAKDGESTPGSQAPHGPPNVLGTKDRKTKSGKSTGRVKANGFIRRAAKSAAGKVRERIKSVLTVELTKLAAKSK